MALSAEERLEWNRSRFQENIVEYGSFEEAYLSSQFERLLYGSLVDPWIDINFGAKDDGKYSFIRKHSNSPSSLMGGIISRSKATGILGEKMRNIDNLDEENARKGIINLELARKDRPYFKQKLWDLINLQYLVVEDWAIREYSRDPTNRV